MSSLHIFCSEDVIEMWLQRSLLLIAAQSKRCNSCRNSAAGKLKCLIRKAERRVKQEFGLIGNLLLIFEENI